MNRTTAIIIISVTGSIFMFLTTPEDMRAVIKPMVTIIRLSISLKSTSLSFGSDIFISS